MAGFAGFHYTFHEMPINEAFVQIKKRNLPNAARLDEIIDRHAAIEASTQLDDDENGAPDQYKRSTRLNGVSLPTAKARSSRDIDDQRSDAIHAAVRGDRVTAGRLIGRILHAVQDRKHL
jgi:DNA-binding transcriptional regulator LsrR (DeoR family)